METNNRFADANYRMSDFYNEVLVVCPHCKSKAVASVDHEITLKATLVCPDCNYITQTSIGNQNGKFVAAAHWYFSAELWLAAPFKGDVFLAYNYRHLDYLEQYIGAKLREHKDRSHFTLLEKLPLFYHEAKNRDRLLKLIAKLRKK